MTRLPSALFMLLLLPSISLGQSELDRLKRENARLLKLNRSLNLELSKAHRASLQLALRDKKIKKLEQQRASLSIELKAAKGSLERQARSSKRALRRLRFLAEASARQRDRRLERLLQTLEGLRPKPRSGKAPGKTAADLLDRPITLSLSNDGRLGEGLAFLSDVFGIPFRLAPADASLTDTRVEFNLRAPLRHVLTALATSHPTLVWRFDRKKNEVVFSRAARVFRFGHQRSALDLAFGKGDRSETFNTVTVRYVGKLEDGTVFTRTPKGKPARFSLRRTGHLWEEGILGMRVGGKRTLTLQPKPLVDPFHEKAVRACSQCKPAAKHGARKLTIEVELLKVE